MNEFELSTFLLARMLRHENDEFITHDFLHFDYYPVNENYTKIIDAANLPFLVDFYAADNEAACKIIEKHRLLKRIEMLMETPMIYEKFHNAIKRKFEGKRVSKNILHVLINMIQVPDNLCPKTAFGLLAELDIGTKACEDILQNFSELCMKHPEGEILLQKIQRVIAYPNSVDQDPVHDDVEELDDKFGSDIGEVVMRVFGSFIISGEIDKINYAIRLLEQFPIPFHLFKKYEMTCMINKHARHCETALNLWRKIDNFDKELMENEDSQVFDRILECVEKCPFIAENTMYFLVEYLKTGKEEQKGKVVEMLIRKEVTPAQFEKHNVGKWLNKFSGKTNKMMELLVKIQKMKNNTE